MFPPKREAYYSDRLNLQADLPWEPWLHCGVWIGVTLTLIFGEVGVVPPFDTIDSFWIFFGLVSPPVGFFSVWALEDNRGKPRYIAIWTRMSADIGLAACIFIYLVARGQLSKVDIHFISDIILIFSAWFTLVLVHRDIKFLITTEKLASVIHQREIDEWTDDGC